MKRIYVTDADQLRGIADDLRNMVVPEFGIHITIETGQRTMLQNSAMHRYFELLGSALNDAGLDMRRVFEVFKDSVEIPWTPANVKEHLWRPIQIAQFGKKSTTKLDRKEVSEVYKTLTRFLTQRLSVNVPFPQSRHPE